MIKEVSCINFYVYTTRIWRSFKCYQAIISAEATNSSDRAFIRSIKQILFFGVPHQGMKIESLVPMVKDQPNRALVETLGRNSAVLQRHDKEFTKAFDPETPDIVSFYETKMSPTAQMVSSVQLRLVNTKSSSEKWKMGDVGPVCRSSRSFVSNFWQYEKISHQLYPFGPSQVRRRGG